MPTPATATIIMLYGVIRSHNENLHRDYFRMALGHRAEEHSPIYVGGGNLGSPRQRTTLAGAACVLLRKHFILEAVTVHPHPRGECAREVLEDLASIIAKNVRVRIICAYVHQDEVRAHAFRLFGMRAEVFPVPFPDSVKRRPFYAMFKRAWRLPKVLLSLASVYSASARRVERWHRKRIILDQAAFPRDFDL